MRRKGQQIYLDEGDWCDITSIPPAERRKIFPQIPSWFGANTNEFCILFGTGAEEAIEVDAYSGNNDLRRGWIEDIKSNYEATKDISIYLTESLGDW